MFNFDECKNIFTQAGKDLERECQAIVGDVAKALDPEINRLLINHIVNQAHHRPHPWSTFSPYTSWTALTDRTWSGRSLPELPLPENLPTEQAVAEIFRRREPQALSTKSTLVFPAFAQYLTDGFIRTVMPPLNQDTDDNPSRRRNTSNHEIDLCPLYGRTEGQTAILRLNSEAVERRGGSNLKFETMGKNILPSST